MDPSLQLFTPEKILSILSLSPNATAIYTGEAVTIQAANDAMLGFWGKDRSVIGKPMAVGIPELKDQPFIDIIKNVWLTGISYEAKNTAAQLNIQGRLETFYFDFLYQAIKNEKGETYCILHTAADVTERHLVRESLLAAREQEKTLQSVQLMNNTLSGLNELLEERVTLRTRELKESTDKLEQAVTTGNMGTWSIDPVTLQVSMSDFIKTLFGFPVHEEIAMEKIIEAIHPDYRQALQDVLGNAVTNHTSSDITYPISNVATGEKKWVRATGKVFFSREGKASAYSGLLIDVTEQVQSKEKLEENFNDLQVANTKLADTNARLTVTQQQLQEIIKEQDRSEARLRYLLADAPIAIAIFNGANLLIETANKKVLEAWGKDSSIIGKPLAEAVPELVGQPFLQWLEDVYHTGVPFHGNEVKAMLERNGVIEEVYSNFVYQPIRDPVSNTTSVMLTANVVTEQVKSRKKVEHAEESLRLAIDAAELASFSVNTITREFQSSPRLREFFGFRPDEDVPYESFISQIHPDYRQAVAAMAEATITNGTKFDIEHAVIGFHDGRLRWVRGIGTIQYDNNSNDSYFTGVLHEITEKKLEEIRKNAFIGVVSHELKTPLTAMSGYLQLLQQMPASKQDASISFILEKSYNQVKKMNSLITGFLNISRLESGKVEIKKTVFALNELVQHAVEEGDLLFPGRDLRIATLAAVAVLADKEKISNVLFNLLSNAVKYSSPASPVTLACELRNGFAVVSVEDKGIGIRKGDMDKIFQRFYRADSDPTIAGFGIGLYLCAEFIHRHNGRIWVESEEGKGSVFFFSLPVQQL